MKIAMVCPQISSSSFITTYPYAKILSEEHDVTLIGPLLGEEPFIRDDDLDFEIVEPVFGRPAQVALTSTYLPVLRKLREIDPDVIHAFKLFPNTAMPAAKAKEELGSKLVVTVDDYDAISPDSLIKRWILRVAERARKKADQMIVSSTYLQEVYGGEIIYQVSNEPLFLEGEHDGERVRQEYGLEDEKVVLYAGTIFEHKGVDILIEAVQDLDRDDVKLVLLGNGDTEMVEETAGEETLFLGTVPMEEIPDFIDACDVYAVPTRDTGEYARAQIPGKIFEPMMMGKAVLATRMSDIPLILNEGEAGMVVEPDSVDALKEGLEELLESDDLREELGERARERYLAEYSYDRIGEKAREIYGRL